MCIGYCAIFQKLYLIISALLVTVGTKVRVDNEPGNRSYADVLRGVGIPPTEPKESTLKGSYQATLKRSKLVGDEKSLNQCSHSSQQTVNK